MANPYAEFATDNPYAGFASEPNPYADVKPDNSATQWLGVTNRALLPYATAATAGAAAGAPFGGVGAIPGAAAGVASLGLTDLGTSLYNAVVPRFGYPRVPTGSEAIQNLYGAAGIGREPQTPEQSIYAKGLEAAAGGFGQAKAAGTVANALVENPTTKNILLEMSKQPSIQAAGAAGAGAAPETLRQYGGVENPMALMASSLVGGVLGAKTAAGVADRIERAGAAIDRAKAGGTPTTDELRAKSQQAYAKAEDAGMVFKPEAYDNLVGDIKSSLNENGFDENLSPKIADALKVLDKVSGQPQTLQKLDNLRKIISPLRGDKDRNQGRLASDIIDKIDDFVTKSSPDTLVEGNADIGVPAIKEARALWAKQSRSSEIEELIRKSDFSAASNPADAIRAQFATLARNPNRLRRFSDAEQKMITDIASGASENTILKYMSAFAPGTDLKGLIASAATLGPAATGYMYGSPETTGVGIGLAALGAGARMGRNALAQRNATNVAEAIRRGDARIPITANNNLLLSPVGQQMINDAGQ